MPCQQISKMEALQLIAAVVDGEVSPDKRKAFLQCVQNYPDIRRRYESSKKIKKLLSNRCPKEKAPASLHKRIRELLVQLPGHDFDLGQLN